FVVNEDGVIVAHTFAPRVPPEVRALQGDPDKTLIRQVSVAGLGECLDVCAPVLGGEVGFVHVGLDLGEIRSAIAATVQRLLLLVGLRSLVAGGGAWAVRAGTAPPLRRRTGSARPLAAADTTAARAAPDAQLRADGARPDEVGQLAQALHHLVEEVASREAK